MIIILLMAVGIIMIPFFICFLFFLGMRSVPYFVAAYGVYLMFCGFSWKILQARVLENYVSVKATIVDLKDDDGDNYSTYYNPIIRFTDLNGNPVTTVCHGTRRRVSNKESRESALKKMEKVINVSYDPTMPTNAVPNTYWYTRGAYSAMVIVGGLIAAISLLPTK